MSKKRIKKHLRRIRKLVNKEEGSQTVKQSNELLDLMGWSSNNIPPVIIERNFTTFRKTFEKAMMNEIADYSSLKNEAKKHLGITKESKPLIARYIPRNLLKKVKKKEIQENMFLKQ